VTDQTVRKWIKRVTAKHLGQIILPHSFRHSAATTFTFEKPGKTMDAAALLGHASAATTERHYILHQRATAVSKYHTILDGHKYK
jgi:integrase